MGETVFAFPLKVLLIPVAVALVALALSVWALLRGQRQLGFVAGFVALLSGGMFAPAMFCDRVRVSSQRIEQTTGLPWAPTVKGFQYNEVKWVHIGTRQTEIGPAQQWGIYYRDGRSESLDPGDLWEKNSPRIVPLLKKYGVQFR